jgi:hypothetical protein
MVVFLAFCNGRLGTGGKTHDSSSATPGNDPQRSRGGGRGFAKGWLGKRGLGDGGDHHSGIVRQAAGGQVEGSDL